MFGVWSRVYEVKRQMKELPLLGQSTTRLSWSLEYADCQGQGFLIEEYCKLSTLDLLLPLKVHTVKLNSWACVADSEDPNSGYVVVSANNKLEKRKRRLFSVIITCLLMLIKGWHQPWQA